MNFKNSLNKIFIIITNLIPLLGVMFLSWNLLLIIFFYWVETIFIGIINIEKIKKAEGTIIPEDLVNTDINGLKIGTYSKNELSKKFISFYLYVSVICGVFLFVIFGVPNLLLNFAIANLSLVLISHLISYKINYIDKGEYLDTHPSSLFVQPQTRIIIMIAIIFAGSMFYAIGGQFLGLLVMIFFKIKIDISSYYHKSFIKFVSFSSK